MKSVAANPSFFSPLRNAGHGAQAHSIWYAKKALAAKTCGGPQPEQNHGTVLSTDGT